MLVMIKFEQNFGSYPISENNWFNEFTSIEIIILKKKRIHEFA